MLIRINVITRVFKNIYIVKNVFGNKFLLKIDRTLDKGDDISLYVSKKKILFFSFLEEIKEINYLDSIKIDEELLSKIKKLNI